MTRRAGGRWASVIIAVASLAARAEAGAMYRVTDLGDMRVSSLSNAGHVVGEDGSTSRSVIFRDGVRTTITEPGYSYVRGAVISPGGTLAYSVDDRYTAHTQVGGRAYEVGSNPVHWTRVSVEPASWARAVNDAGTVAGYSRFYPWWNRAFMSYLDQDGRYNPVGMGANGGTVSAALAVSGSGSVVGWSDAGGWRNHAFLDNPSNDIGTLGGRHSVATGINDARQVVGWSNVGTDWVPPANPQSYSTPEPFHAFLYEPGSGMKDLGTLPGFLNSRATAINEAGQVVGNAIGGPGGFYAYDGFDAARAGDNGERAILFQGGSVVDLNDLIGPDTGWILKSAIDINDSGQIVGYGTLDGASRSYLLTPVPEPTALALLGLAGATVAARAAGRRALRRP